MKRISLTKNRFALVDDEDFDWLSQFNWYVGGGGRWIYAYRWVAGKNEAMHRIIMKAPRHMEVDHINGIGFDNRKSNLRLCTHSQNVRNRIKKDETTTSCYKGVHWDSNRKKWRAAIKFNKVTTHLGDFDDEVDAARAYNDKAQELFREFARLNVL